jgi:hypothetical protein
VVFGYWFFFDIRKSLLWTFFSCLDFWFQVSERYEHLDFSGENFVCNEVFASECFFGSYFWFA